MSTPKAASRNRLHGAALLVLLATAGPASANAFGEVIPWTTIPIHAGLMPDGNVMTFGATPTGGQGGFDVTIWNPRQGNGPASRVVVPNSFSFDMLLHRRLLNPADGNMMLAGGNANERVSQFSSSSRRLLASIPSAFPRWYATTTTLPDGRIHLVGGVPAYCNQTNASTISEVFTAGRGWTRLPNTAAGPMRRGDPAATGNPFWYPHVFPVRGTEVFIVAGRFQYFENYAGAGGIRDARPFAGSNYGASSSAVMFRPGRVMQVGGGAGGQQRGLAARAPMWPASWTCAVPTPEGAPRSLAPTPSCGPVGTGPLPP